MLPLLVDLCNSSSHMFIPFHSCGCIHFYGLLFARQDTYEDSTGVTPGVSSDCFLWNGDGQVNCRLCRWLCLEMTLKMRQVGWEKIYRCGEGELVVRWFFSYWKNLKALTVPPLLENRRRRSSSPTPSLFKTKKEKKRETKQHESNS